MRLKRSLSTIPTLLALLGLSSVAHAATALDMPYQRLPVRLLPETVVTDGLGNSQTTIDWAAVGIAGYTNPQVDGARISRDGWIAAVIVDDTPGSVLHTVLRRDPSTGVWTNLGKPTDATATTVYADGRDADIDISYGGWVSLIYWPTGVTLPTCRLYGPTAGSWSTPLAGGNNLIIEKFDQSSATTRGVGWTADPSQIVSNTAVIGSYIYDPGTNTLTSLSASLPYNSTTYPRGILASLLHGAQIAGAVSSQINPDFIAAQFTGTVGTPGDFRVHTMPTPSAVTGADWTASANSWETQIISSLGVIFDCSDATDNFQAAAFQAAGSTAAPTLIALPSPYNSIDVTRGVDLTDGGFFANLRQLDSGGNPFSGIPVKWTPTGVVSRQVV